MIAGFNRHAILITGDSIIQFLGHPLGADLATFPGARVSTITQALTGFWSPSAKPVLVVERYKILVIHVGTNNLRQPLADIRQDFRDLLQAIRSTKNQLRVVFSCILPRPSDFPHTQSKVLELNDWLRFWASREGLALIDAYRIFAFGHTGVREDLFFDGLHLSESGLIRLRSKFRQVLTPLV